MTYLRRIVSLAVLVLFGILVFQNQDALAQRLELKFFRYRQDMVLGFWILFTFVAGALFAMAFDFWRHLGLRWEILRKDQELQKLRQQAAKTPASGATGTAKDAHPAARPPSPPPPVTPAAPGSGSSASPTPPVPPAPGAPNA